MFIVYRESKVYYKKTLGEGEPILFLHGWGGNTASFEYFAKGKNAYLIDLPPFGKSAEPKYVYNLDDYVNITLDLLKKENLQKVNVCAHSFGCRVAIMLARLGVVNKLLITGGAGLKPRYSIKKSCAVIKYKLAKFGVKMKLVPKSHLDKYGSSDYKSLSPIMKKTFCNIINFRQNNMLKDIKCATLLVWGEKDTETPPYMAKTFEKNIKDSGLIVFEGLGHFAYIEKAFAFEKILNNFFKD